MLGIPRYYRSLVLLALLGALILMSAIAVLAQGPGDLLVAPTRVILTDRQRTGELLLMNAGTAPATYRITFTHLRMSETGGIQEISKPASGELFCDSMVRYSPRQVTLNPKESQTVRLQLRLPAGLEEGEYRSHLQFKAIPQNPPEKIDNAPEKPASEVTVKLVATFGVSIPVIVRHGRTSASATISNVSLMRDAAPDQPLILSAVIERTGNQSVYGDLVATFSNGKGKPVSIANIGGVAVYTPNSKRIVKLELKPPKDLDLRSGHITLSYKEKSADGGKLIAEGTVDVP